MSNASPRLVTEIDEEMKSKINTVCDFVMAHQNQIASVYQRWYTSKEAAIYIGVSKSTLLNSLRSKLPPIENGRKLMYDRNDLDKYWEEIKASNKN